jgi:hypothetical protein
LIPKSCHARSIRDIVATSSRSFSLGPVLPRNASDDQLRDHLEREYSAFMVIRAEMDTHKFNSMGYDDGLFLVVCGLLSFGRKDVLHALAPVVTCDAPYMRRLCILIRGMLKVPADLDLDPRRAAFAEWIANNAERLTWQDDAGTYTLG